MVTHDFSNPVDRKFSVENCGQRSSTATKRGTQLQSSFNPAHSVGAISKGSLNQALWIEHCFPAKGVGTADSIKTSNREGVDRIDSIVWVYYAAILGAASIVHIQHFVSHSIVPVRALCTLEVYKPINHACIQDDGVTLYGVTSSRT